ncbi:MAG: hypothetical protein FWG73_06105 [Planctomycetaceae bacterium]|nr:hypothetical protein [Planctomycetaceae bacterium]
MTAFQTQAFVPLDGNLSITLPESLRGKKVKLSAEPDRKNEQDDDTFTLFCKKLDSVDSSSMSEEEFFEGLRSVRGWLANRPKMSDEEYIAWMDKFRGSLHNVDYSDLREDTDREI